MFSGRNPRYSTPTAWVRLSLIGFPRASTQSRPPDRDAWRRTVRCRPPMPVVDASRYVSWPRRVDRRWRNRRPSPLDDVVFVSRNVVPGELATWPRIRRACPPDPGRSARMRRRSSVLVAELSQIRRIAIGHWTGRADEQRDGGLGAGLGLKWIGERGESARAARSMTLTILRRSGP